MHTKILIEGLSLFRATKCPQETFDSAAAGHYFSVNIPKVGFYQVTTTTFFNCLLF